MRFAVQLGCRGGSVIWRHPCSGARISICLRLVSCGGTVRMYDCVPVYKSFEAVSTVHSWLWRDRLMMRSPGLAL